MVQKKKAMEDKWEVPLCSVPVSELVPFLILTLQHHLRDTHTKKESKCQGFKHNKKINILLKN